MKSNTQLLAIGLALVLVSLISAPRVLAQNAHDHSSDGGWKTGMLRISEPVLAGDVRLSSGMYHVTHLVSGNTHVIVIKSVALLAGYKESSMVEQKEVARLECRVEPASKSMRNTKVSLGKNAAGQSVILEIQIAGESVKHILSANARQLSQGNH